MRHSALAALLVLAGCTGGDGAGPATPMPGDSSLDGRYVGTVTSISPASCGQAGGRVTMTLVNGALSMPVLGGQGSVVGRVDGGGSISQVSFSSAAFSGSSTGHGRISQGNATLHLETFRTGGYIPCIFTYSASKAA